MILNKIGLFVIISTLTLVSLNGNDPQREAMVKDLEIMKHHFTHCYAPANLKKELFGWDLEDQFQQAKDQILSQPSMTVKDYQQILKRIFRSTRDYHAEILFYSSEAALFPLKLRSCNNRYFLEFLPRFHTKPEFFAFSDKSFSEISAQLTAACSLGLKTGDELLAIDDIAIQDVIEKIIDDELGGDRTATGYATAKNKVFARKGEEGNAVPSGFFKLTVKDKNNGNIASYNLPWIHNSDKIYEPQSSQKSDHISCSSPSETPALDDDSENNESNDDDEKHPPKVQDKRYKGFLPPLGKVLWETDNDKSIYAYLYENESGQRIGYFYLDSFDYSQSTLEEIIQLIKRFDQDSQALVVDITDNPGGTDLYMYAILSLLTNQPLQTMLTEVLVDQKGVYSALGFAGFTKNDLKDDPEILPKFYGYPVDDACRQELIQYADNLKKAYDAGQRMTDRIPTKLSQISPHPEVQYTKPLLVLINELAYSCGDLFPAILQDNGRAILFGKKTTGAGGGMEKYTYPNQFGVCSFTLTTSLIYRLDGTLIENNGVTPDIPYEITMRDLEDNYADYIKAVNDAVKGLVTQI